MNANDWHTDTGRKPRYTSRLHIWAGDHWLIVDSDPVDPHCQDAAEELCHWLARTPDPGTYLCTVVDHLGNIVDRAEGGAL